MAQERPAPPGAQFGKAVAGGGAGEARRFLRRAAAFVGIGLLLYTAIYAWSESLVREHALRNRFHVVQTAPRVPYDYVILGASHAAVFDYRDLNERLEEAAAADVVNLATVGGGITINRFLLDYFLSKHEARAVVYILDSFAFYSPEWNEERIQDVELLRRAPWDAGLAAALVSQPETRGVALDYITGFSKINDGDRFAADVFEAEGTRFERSYRPIPQIERQRLEFLYPQGASDSLLHALPYLAELEALIQEVQGRGMRFIIVRPPLPERMYETLPNEESFGRAVEEVAQRNGAAVYDFTHVNNDPELFYDSDHLNLDGATRFIDAHLGPALRAAASSEARNVVAPARAGE